MRRVPAAVREEDRHRQATRRLQGSRGLQGLPAGWRPPQASPDFGGLQIWACQDEALILGFRVFPSRGKSMYIVEIWPIGVAGGRAVPPDVREEPGGALYVHSP